MNVRAILFSSTTDNSFDVNGDGSVDISDVVSLVNTILNGTGTGSDDNSQAYLTCPDENHPHMIDLGLPSGTKWACCNVDTDYPENQSPANCGGYYAWGETKTKSTYNESTYEYYNSSSGYQNLGSDISGTEYDVAHVKWGGSWRMPTLEQCKELVDNCTYEWTEMNGMIGAKFTSKNNEGSVFLPAGGNYYTSGLNYLGEGGGYWSSSRGLFSNCAYGLNFSNSGVTSSWANISRNCGFTIRPVVSK